MIRAESGMEYKRNITHVKKLVKEEPVDKQDEWQLELSTPTTESQMVDCNMDSDRVILPEQDPREPRLYQLSLLILLTRRVAKLDKLYLITE